ncbi:MAG: lipoyl(octanoyl) transferase LipB [Candidatus Omnitrophica bacterium]|nr:lipoyl(octanoyl) transferase LipB [Candidatus Omnitrophota bacterium]MBU4479488.1 lipoyl(octanoyl) transferase LipB [Candidatus Omnitrophota bacterium]MCG2703712.1 lipoyl(octanoyl) transferase LipB [Candidatus Omnitrophota bacterium]
MSVTKTADCDLLYLSTIDYGRALLVQKELHKKRCTGDIPDTLIFCEHPTVITLGRRAARENILVSEEYLRCHNIPVISTDRGGDVTLHAPGQIVAYPIFDLKRIGKDIRLFLRKLEEVMLSFLYEYGIYGQRVDGRTGVWIEDRKIGFIGIAISKWVSYHGISVNVNADLNFFRLIYPCGIKDKLVTSLCCEPGRKVSVQEAGNKLACAFATVFDLAFTANPNALNAFGLID